MAPQASLSLSAHTLFRKGTGNLNDEPTTALGPHTVSGRLGIVFMYGCPRRSSRSLALDQSPPAGQYTLFHRLRERSVRCRGLERHHSHLRNGYVWTEKPLRNTGTFYSIIYAKGIFVAVGQAGAIATSSDGVQWTLQTSRTIHDLKAIVYGKDLFVAVGSNGTILSSADGTEWTNQASGIDANLSCIAYGNDTFIAGGDCRLTSPDGVAWTAEERTTNDGYITLASIIYHGSEFLAAGYRHCGAGWCMALPGTTIFTSPDGVIWTEKVFLFGGDVNNFIRRNGKLIAVGNIGTWNSSGAPFISTDGVTWAEQTCTDCGLGNSLRGIAWGSNTSVAVGNLGVILVSSDGETWARSGSRVLRSDARLNDIAYGSPGFVAVGGAYGSPVISYEDLGPMEEGYVPILTSPDGMVWTARNSGISRNHFNALTYGKNTYVVVGGNGLILTSPDGVDWTVRPSGTDMDIYALAYGNDKFVAIINGSAVLTSPNGLEWTKSTPENVILPNDMAYGNGLFIAVGYDGGIISSPDGIEWTKRVSGTAHELKGVSFGNNTFIAVGNHGTILTSPNGIDWTEKTSGTSSDLTGIDFGNNVFIAYGDSGIVLDLASYRTTGVVLTSADGKTWRVRDASMDPRLCGVSYGAESLIAVGCSGEIVRAAGSELADAVMALQILTGKMPVQTGYKNADVDEDGRIGLQDTLNIMQSIAEFR
jgi:hypothetical protein